MQPRPASSAHVDPQDFDAYARFKTFNLNVAETWSTTLCELLDTAGVPRAGVRLLDYGCGDGKLFAHLVGLGMSPDNVHGMEISRLRIERCQARGWKQAVFVETGARLPYPDDFFDIVNMMEVIEHIPGAAIGAVLDEIARVLKPSGVLLGTTPNYPIKRFYDLYEAFIHQRWARLKDDPTHVSLYNHRRLRALLTPRFDRVEERCFKPGFLYKRARSPFLMHKVMFVCRSKRAQPAPRAT